MDNNKAEGAVVLINSVFLSRVVYMDKVGVCVYSVTVAQGPVITRLSVV